MGKPHRGPVPKCPWVRGSTPRQHWEGSWSGQAASPTASRPCLARTEGLEVRGAMGCAGGHRGAPVSAQEMQAAAGTTLCVPRAGGSYGQQQCHHSADGTLGATSSCHHFGDPGGNKCQGGSTPGYMSQLGLQKSGIVLKPGIMGCGDKHCES